MGFTRYFIFLILFLPLVHAEPTISSTMTYYVNTYKYETSHSSTNTFSLVGSQSDGGEQKLDISQGDTLTLSIENTSINANATILNPLQFQITADNWTEFHVLHSSNNAEIKMTDGEKSMNILDGYDVWGFVVNVTSLENYITSQVDIRPDQYTDISTNDFVGYKVSSVAGSQYILFNYTLNVQFYRTTGLLKSYTQHMQVIGQVGTLDLAISDTPTQSSFKVDAFIPISFLFVFVFFRKRKIMR